MSKRQLQDDFYSALREERVPVSIYLLNGVKLQGEVASFDQFVVWLQGAINQMVYKRAISTIVPTRNVDPSIRKTQTERLRILDKQRERAVVEDKDRAEA